MHDTAKDFLQMNQPWEKAWPREGLESITNCPLCGSSEREVLHSGLVDNVFHVAPGAWTLQRCLGCQSAYLDPRPTEKSIHLAYTKYYTHTTPNVCEKYEVLSPWRRLRRSLANGYCNRRYGTKYYPSSSFGTSVAWLLPTLRHSLDLRHRFLPPSKEGASLLDVGFGNGAFLELAKAAGWLVAGVDPDPIAVKNAKARGMDVHLGGIDVYNGITEYFDAITISHVIEHLHDPVAVIRTIYALLKPGGILYIDTPNINAYGHHIFGPNWRGLEPPRHLVIFSALALKMLLSSVGFSCVRSIRRYDVSHGMYQSSLSLQRGVHPSGVNHIPPTWRSFLFSVQAHLNMSEPEFLTILAKKGMQS